MILYEDFLTLLPQATEHGRYLTGLCPFHPDSSPSLLVFKDGWFRCLGCARQGTWKTLWNKLKGQPLQVRTERQTQWSSPSLDGMDLEDVCYQAHDDLLEFPSFGWYLEMRGLSDSIEPCELGYWNGWYTIPVRDDEGKFQTAVFRAAPHVQEATGMRYWCPHAPFMYVPNWPRFHKNSSLFIVYGMLDAVALFQLGYSVATTTAGQLTFDPTWLEEYRNKIIVLPDKGEERAAMQLCAHLGWRGKVRRLNYPDGIKDPSGFLEANRGVELTTQMEKL